MSSRRRDLLWWAPVGALLGLALHAWMLRNWMLDDAFIFFRYADNWAAGSGPVYNLGERVEGYTSFLWLALLACGRWLGIDTVFLARTLGLVFGVACIVLVALAHRWVPGGSARGSRLAALLLGTCGVFTAWPMSGMEVTLDALLVTSCLLLYVRVIGLRGAVAVTTPRRREPLLFGLAGALLVLARPEGLLLFSILLLDLVRRSPTSRWRYVGWTAAIFAAILIPYLAWRFAYYGYPLPNTFYAKVGGTGRQIRNGIDYSLRFLIPVAALVVPFAAAVLSRRWSERYPTLAVLPVLLVVDAVAVTLVGGDLMPAFRFYAPILPLLSLGAGWSLVALEGRRRWAVPAALLAAAYGVAGMQFVPEIGRRIRDDHVAQVGMIVGTWLAANVPPDAVLATNTAGSVPYYSGLRTIDMLGLNDAHIAHRRMDDLGGSWIGHEKADGAYVLARRPDYVMFGSSLGSIQPAFASDRELDAQPLFHQLYEPRVYDLTLDSGGTLTISLWRKTGLRYP
jgi:arabinofuranosyltransferase